MNFDKKKTNVPAKQEITTISTFVKKAKADRLLFELSKDRNRAIDRFSHNVEELLTNDFVFKKTKAVSDVESFLEGSKLIFVSSLYDNGGNDMRIDIFLNFLQESFGPIIGSIDSNKAIIKDEEGFFYLLNSKL